MATLTHIFHKWTDWTLHSRRMFHTRHNREYEEEYQRRRCTVCGKYDEEIL